MVDNGSGASRSEVKRDSLGSLEEEDNSGSGQVTNGKRKSTGSISSLRKMWEANPKMASKKDGQIDEASSEVADPLADKTTVKFEKRVWPPVPNTETEKPMVPVKPTVQKPPAPTTKPPPPKEPLVKPPPKPAMAVKPNVCNIYAAPTPVAASRSSASGASAASSASKPPVAAKKPSPPKTGPSGPVPSASSGNRSSIPSGHEATQSGGSGCSSSEASERDKEKDELLVISAKLETTLDSVKADMSKTKLIKLSDDLGSFKESASGFVDNVPATGRFRFRSLLNKLEQQSGELRRTSTTASSKKAAASDAPARLCGDIQVTVRDLVTVIQR